MISWLPNPCLRISLVFILGIYYGMEFGFHSTPVEWSWLLGFVLFVIWGLAPEVLTVLHRFIRSSGNTGSNPFERNSALTNLNDISRILNPGCCLLGLTLIFITAVLRTQWAPHQPETPLAQASYYQARLIQSTYRENGRLILEIEWYWASDKLLVSNDKVLWVPSDDSIKKDASNSWTPGTRFIVKGPPNAIGDPSNPLEFNYALIMSRENVFWQHWIEHHQLLTTVPGKPTGVNYWSARSREKLGQILTDHLPGGPSQQIAQAMLLGDRLAIAKDLKRAFADIGVIHVLAVSGLHLGILYWLLVKLFGQMRKHRRLLWVFTFISIVILWFYTLVTGMSPSTQRAAIMFSFILLGQAIHQHAASKNSLGIAAMVILYLDPYQLYAVGFQLSFAAMIGILYLQPMFSHWYRNSSPLARSIGELITVSLAAQIAVFPISVYYFHQLPLYFLVANLLVIPLAFGVVLVGILFLLLHFFPIVSEVLSGALETLTLIMYGVVEVMADLPSVALRELHMEVLGVVFWYLLIITTMKLVSLRHKTHLRLLILLVLCALILRIPETLALPKRQLMTVYHIPNHTAIDLVAGSRCASIMDGELLEDPNTIAYKIQNFRRSLHLSLDSPQIGIIDQHPGVEIWKFNGKRVVLVRSVPDKIPDGIQLNADLAVIAGNSLSDLRKITPWVDANYWVVDGSNKPWISYKLEQQAIEMGLRIHNCWTDGAFILTI